MIPFTGNMQAKQFVRGKLNPWGLKNFVLCGSNGLAFDFLLFQGKTTGVNPEKELGVSASVVLKLCERLETKGIELFFDNYFNSYNLLQVLKAKEIFSGGTARISRFYKPPLLDDKEMKTKPRGFSDECVSQDGDLVLCKWQDKRTVLMASNYLSIGECDEVQRWEKTTRTKIGVSRPQIIKEYNQSMGVLTY